MEKNNKGCGDECRAYCVAYPCEHSPNRFVKTLYKDLAPVKRARRLTHGCTRYQRRYARYERLLDQLADMYDTQMEWRYQDGDAACSQNRRYKSFERRMRSANQKLIAAEKRLGYRWIEALPVDENGCRKLILERALSGNPVSSNEILDMGVAVTTALEGAKITMTSKCVLSDRDGTTGADMGCFDCGQCDQHSNIDKPNDEVPF